MIRALRPDDLRFIRSTWRRSYASSEWAQANTPAAHWEATGEGGQTYWNGHALVIDALIASSVVYVDQAEDGLIDGWVCGFPRVLLHYVYVRQAARRRGTARRLLEALELRPGIAVSYTHLTRAIRPVPAGWSGYGWIPRREKTMAQHRISHIRFADNNSVPYRGPNGDINHRDSLRESDKFTAHLDDAKGLVTIEGKRKTFVHVSQCRYIEVYGPGEGPAWEAKDEKAP